MINILIMFLLISLSILVSSKYLEKSFGKFGLLAMQIILLFISNIIVLKRFPIWGGQSLTMSVLVYPYIFIVGSHIQKKYGEQVLNKFNNITIISNAIFVIILTIASFANSATKTNVVDEMFSIVDKSGHFQPGLVAMTIFSFVALFCALKTNSIITKLLKNINETTSVIISSIVSSTVDSIVFVIFGLWLFSGFIPANSVVTEILILILGKSVVSIPNAIAYSLSNNNSKEEEEENKSNSEKENNK